MTRQEIHDLAVAWVVGELRGRGCAVELRCRHEARGTTLGVVVPGRTGRPMAVAVRAALGHGYAHVTRAGGRAYRYRYQARRFNLHVRGHRVARADVWVLVAVDDVAATLVVPARALGQRTVVTVRAQPIRAGRGIWDALIGRWDLIVGTQQHAA